MSENIPPGVVSQDDLDKNTQAWMRMINCIVHDMTTPLASMRVTGQMLKKLFPELLHGYKLAVSHQLVSSESALTQRYLETLESVTTDIEKNAGKMQEFLNLLHPYNQKLLVSAADPQLYISACIEQALQNYQFADQKQRALIQVDSQNDFAFQADAFFVEHLLFNLIENALSSINKAGKGKIYIYIEEQDQYYCLHFKNTSGYMDEDVASQAFRSFFLKHNNTILPALGFCRLKWLQMGGDIICNVVSGEGIDFLVKFPKS